MSVTEIVEDLVARVDLLEKLVNQLIFMANKNEHQ